MVGWSDSRRRREKWVNTRLTGRTMGGVGEELALKNWEMRVWPLQCTEVSSLALNSPLHPPGKEEGLAVSLSCASRCLSSRKPSKISLLRAQHI